MPGPLPAGTPRRRNAPTISTRLLPAEGRTDPVPDPPDEYELAGAGMAWWEWAWRLPQATMWDAGTMYLAARRAKLEDDRAALRFVDELDLSDLLAGSDKEAIRRVEWALTQLKRLASGETTLMKEMRELDDRLGLSPKAMAALRWTIADSEPDTPADVPRMADYRARLG